MAPVVKWNTPEETLDIEFKDHEEEYPNSFYDYWDGNVPGEPEGYIPGRHTHNRTPPSPSTLALGLPLLTALRVDPLLWGRVDANYNDKSGSNNATPTPSPCHDEKAVELAPSGGGIKTCQRPEDGAATAGTQDENREEDTPLDCQAETVQPADASEDGREPDTALGVRLSTRVPISLYQRTRQAKDEPGSDFGRLDRRTQGREGKDGEERACLRPVEGLVARSLRADWHSGHASRYTPMTRPSPRAHATEVDERRPGHVNQAAGACCAGHIPPAYRRSSIIAASRTPSMLNSAPLEFLKKSILLLYIFMFIFL
ncbi:hypothetical protein D9613_000059 [Agrocybe pediades]|uniref:Uncharacterized protein n=1 Tax=Agrocybe pediades TaxID=84607 RepID=A0A8H4VSR6_9AGAR|nr:hypothetical protein D9613_000059 [Agrocybe pediades]